MCEASDCDNTNSRLWNSVRIVDKLKEESRKKNIGPNIIPSSPCVERHLPDAEYIIEDSESEEEDEWKWKWKEIEDEAGDDEDGSKCCKFSVDDIRSKVKETKEDFKKTLGLEGSLREGKLRLTLNI